MISAIRKYIAKKLTPHTLDLLPHTLIRQRIYILPTKQGFKFLGILTVLLLISLNYNNNLGFLMTFLLGSIFVVSIIYTYRNLAGLTVQSISANPVFVGEEAVFELSLDPLNLPRAMIELSVNKGEITRVEFTDATTQRAKIKVLAKERGLLEPNRITVATRYPFSFFRAWSYLYTDAHCLVYPKPIHAPLPNSRVTDADLNGGVTVKRPGVEDFEGLKNYQPGDSMRQIYWKAFTRGRGLFTKVFSAEHGQVVLLNFETLRVSDLEEKLSVLCGFVLTLNRNRTSFSLNLPKNPIEPGKGEKHMRRCLEALASYGN